MVWKDNFLINDSPTTFNGFLDDYFPLSHFPHNKDYIFLCLQIFGEKVPKHFLFANIMCLRCGLCCKNFEAAEVDKEQIEKWLSEGNSILQHIWILRAHNGSIAWGEVITRSWRGCPLARKVRGKPYYYCRIHAVKEHLPTCKSYLCSKSLPVAHINYRDVDELIESIGLESYFQLIERSWEEGFDYSRSEFKTHKKSI